MKVTYCVVMNVLCKSQNSENFVWTTLQLTNKVVVFHECCCNASLALPDVHSMYAVMVNIVDIIVINQY